jgi:hypothetical protein
MTYSKQQNNIFVKANAHIGTHANTTVKNHESKKLHPVCDFLQAAEITEILITGRSGLFSCCTFIIKIDHEVIISDL